MHRSLATLCLALTLSTGCLHGIDSKPYDVKFGPGSLIPEDTDPVKLLVVVVGATMAAVALSFAVETIGNDER